MTPRFIARQLSLPSGPVGRAVAWIMNRGNAHLNASALRRLEVSGTDRVLEIGFGGGVALPALIRGAAFVVGVDRSRDMVLRARAKFSRDVSAGHADFREGSVESLPFETGSFDKVLTVNTVYFWRPLEAGLAEIRRVLAPGGRVVVGFVPGERMDRMKMPPDIFTSRAPEDVIAALESAGYLGARVERLGANASRIVIDATRAP